VDYQYEFRSDGYNIKVFCISQILKKKSEEEGTLNRLSEDFKKVHDSGQKYYKTFSLN
jgi:hypothetical protein